MPLFSKTTFLEGFKNRAGLYLMREDGKTPFREYRLDEKFLPKGSEYLEGDWEVTVSFTPSQRRKPMAKESKKKIRQEFRSSSLKRDKNTCRGCGLVSKVNGDDLDVHHITDRNEIPNGGYVKENGISLCADCHQKAEEFHSTGVSVPGFSPDELYQKIGSSKERAIEASKKMLH